MATRTIEVCDVCGVRRRDGLETYEIELRRTSGNEAIVFSTQALACQRCVLRANAFAAKAFSATPSGAKRLGGAE